MFLIWLCILCLEWANRKWKCSCLVERKRGIRKAIHCRANQRSLDGRNKASSCYLQIVLLIYPFVHFTLRDKKRRRQHTRLLLGFPSMSEIFRITLWKALRRFGEKQRNCSWSEWSHSQWRRYLAACVQKNPHIHCKGCKLQREKVKFYIIILKNTFFN